MKNTILIILAYLLLLSIHGQKYELTWNSIDVRPIPSWFEDAKFGIFIHWGVYSVPAWRKVESARYASYAEWYYARVMDNKENGGYEFHRNNYGEDFEYRDFAPLFKAELFDPDQWAELFKKSGARYVVLTSKHHDGFCLWPTENKHKTNWNSGDIGPHRDLLGDLSASVKAVGLKMGIYYSIPDWESIPRKLEPKEYYIRESFVEKYGLDPETYRDEILIPQLYELVENYKPSLIFSDAGEWLYDDEFWQTKEFLSWLYNDSPCKDDVVVNDRWCKGMVGKHGDYFSSEYKDADEGRFFKPWEESRGIGGSYGFNRAENAEDYSSSKELIIELIDIVSRGGNLLLNVGPTADGRIPVVMQERLLDIGSWLEVNGEAIYQTRKRKVSNDQNGNTKIYFTAKEDMLYCIFTRWTEAIDIKLLKDEEVKDVSILGYEGEIKWQMKKDKMLHIDIPLLTVDKIPCQYAWTLRFELEY
ncbi:MAG: alpha-L-fucosidase [Bacteroidales bacterium]